MHEWTRSDVHILWHMETERIPQLTNGMQKGTGQRWMKSTCRWRLGNTSRPDWLYKAVNQYQYSNSSITTSAVEMPFLRWKCRVIIPDWQSPFVLTVSTLSVHWMNIGTLMLISKVTKDDRHDPPHTPLPWWTPPRPFRQWGDMFDSSDRSARPHLWKAHGGYRGAPPVPPGSADHWRPGDPVHWTEQSKLMKLRCISVCITTFLSLAATVIYLQFRARETIAVYPESRQVGWFILQIMFFIYECFLGLFMLFQLPDHWNVIYRNSIDFDRIPSDMIHTEFDHNPEHGISDHLKHYPSIDVIIPCYKEDLHLVRGVVIAALGMDYPAQLLSVYLCDDGKDDLKRDMIDKLSQSHSNVHYVRRPGNTHAKPGDVNYTLTRTHSHLVVQLDADFIARPRLIQRLLS